MPRFLILTGGTLAALALTTAALAAQPGPPDWVAEGRSSPDFSACADAGEAYGACVAAAAQAFRDDAAASGHDAASTARRLVRGCQESTGADFGACVAAAVQGLHERGDEASAEVAALAQGLVDGCATLADGEAFGACVSEAARELGPVMGQGDEHRPEGLPGGHPGGTGNVTPPLPGGHPGGSGAVTPPLPGGSAPQTPGQGPPPGTPRGRP